MVLRFLLMVKIKFLAQLINLILLLICYIENVTLTLVTMQLNYFLQAFYKLDDAVFLLRPIARLHVTNSSYENNLQDSSSFKIEIHNEL